MAATTRDKSRPSLVREYCKGCGRCIEACAHGCITAGHEIHPGTGLVPVLMDLERCTECGLCFDACPEPYGLLREEGSTGESPYAGPIRARRRSRTCASLFRRVSRWS